MSCASVLASMAAETSQTPTLEEIRNWLTQRGVPADNLTALPGDVSRRRYLRLATPSGPAIVAAYPGDLHDLCRRFGETTGLLTAVGIRVPQILISDCAKGLTLLEDVGPRTLYDLGDGNPATLADHFWHAVADIERIQSLSPDAVALLNPPLDRNLLASELRQTWSNLFEPHGVVADPDFAGAVEHTLNEICHRLDSQSFVPCHRDFMSRNLVPVEPFPELAVLDHQDLRLGPRDYDLASLLNDSLFPSAELEEEILTQVLGTDPQARRSYHRAAAQRTLKATGTYESFAQRGYPRHRRLIRPTLERFLHHLNHLPEATAVTRELADRLAPIIC